MSSAGHRALRRLGVPEPVTATKAMSVAMSEALAIRDLRLQTSKSGPGKIIENLPAHMRDALEELRSDDISDLRDDYVRSRLARRKV